MPIDPAAPASVGATTVIQEPWLKWPPDRKVWAGGAAGVVTWVILGVLAHFGLDLQGLADAFAPFLGGQHIDVAGTIAGVVTLAVAHYTAPSVRDVVSRVNNAIVKMANADPDNTTTAVVVPEATAIQAAKTDAIAGHLPTETVEKLVATGIVPPSIVGVKP